MKYFYLYNRREIVTMFLFGFSYVISNVGFVLLVLCSVLFVCHYFSSRHKSLPPGPYSVPFIGIYPFLTENPHLYLRRLAQKYGDIYSFTIFGRTYIHLNSLQLIKDAFLRRGNVFSGRDTDFNLLNYVDDVQGIAQTEGEEWREDRRFFLRNVKQFGFGKLEIEPYIHDMTYKMLKKLRESQEKPILAIDVFTLAAMNVVGKIFMSLEYDDEMEEDFIRVQRDAFSFVAEFDSPRLLLSGFWYKYFLFRFSKNYDSYVRTKQAWYSASTKAIDHHIKTFDAYNIRDFTDRFLEVMFEKMKKGKDCKALKIDKLRSILINIYLDGMMTLSGALNNFAQVLALNEDVQDEVREELDRVVGNQRLPSWEDRNNLPFTQATIVELHRLSPVLPLSVPHKCMETTEFHGYIIPKDAILLSNIYSVHYDGSVFENPEICNPRRFLGEKEKKQLDSVISFGIGKRSCIGEQLANMEVFIYITSILQSFKITLPVGMSRDDCKDKHVYEVRFVPLN